MAYIINNCDRLKIDMGNITIYFFFLCWILYNIHKSNICSSPNLFVFFKKNIISLIRKLLEAIFDDNSGVFNSFIEFRFEHPGWALLLSITIIFLFFSALNNEKLENDKKQ